MKKQSTPHTDPSEEMSALRQRIRELEKSERQLKLAEEALKKSEELFRKAFSTNQDSININRLSDGLYVSINEGFTRLMGYTEEDVIGKSSVELNIWENPEDRQRLVAGIRKYGEVKNLEARFRKKDGSIAYGSMSASVIEIAGIPHLLNVTRDITAHIEAEQVLRELNRQRDDLMQAIDMTNTYIFTKDINGRYLYANRHVQELFDKPLEEIIGRRDDAFFSPDTAETIFENDRLVMEGGMTIEREELITPKSLGELRTYWAVKLPLRTPEGTIHGVCGISTDITDRKRMEDELSKSEAKLRKEQKFSQLLLDTSSAFIVAIGFDGKTLMMNRALSDALEYTADEFLGADYLNTFVPVEDRGFLGDVFKGIIQEGKAVVNENRIISKSGRIYLVEWHGRPVINEEEGAVNFFVGVGVDITVRKRAEDEIRRVTAFLDSIVENIPDMVFVKDAKDLRFVLFNQAGEELLGYARSDLIGKCDYDFFPKDQADFFTEKDRDVLRGGEIVDIPEEPIHTLNKGVRTLHTKKVPILDAKGDPEYLLGISEDITERQRAEEVLLKSEKYFRAITEHAADVLFIVDDEGNVTYCSPSAERIVGYRSEELIGRNAFDLIVPADHFRAAADFRKALLTKDIDIPNSFRIRHKNGDILVMEGVGKNLLHDPVIAGFVMNVRDVTDRRRAEEQLRDNETKLSAIFNQIGTGILIIDSDTQTIIEANQTAMDMTGFPKDRIIGQVCHSLVCPAEAGKCPVKDLGQVVDQSERILLSADGGQKEVLKTVYPITIKGRACYLESFIDISDRKRAEKLLRESEERLQRAEKMEALGTLAGGVAHDLNNVLGVVVGYAELLLHSVDSSNPIRSRLVNIMKGGERAAAIVQDLLTLARRGVSTTKIMNLNEMILEGRQSPEFAHLSVQHPGVRVDLELAQDLMNISGSPVHLAKTLYNLCANAGESMANGGILSIKTFNQYLDKPIRGYDEVREGDYAVLTVSDTGEGIPESDLKRIFEPFYTKKVMGRSGTGLGLAVVWGTVKDHRGYINVQSEEGKGSVFSLYFPVTRERITADRVTAAVSQFMGKGETILVVDDVEGQRDLAVEILKKLNYQAESVGSGEEAIRYLQHRKVDLMVLDMIMEPGMDGFDTYRKVLAIHPGQKAIIVSGFSESERVRAAQALGAGAYVKKPYDIERLGLAVREELDGSR